MRWYDGLLVGCLFVALLVAILVAVAYGVHLREPSPVPYVTPTPQRLT